jgi:hypothetical protein
VIRTLENTTFVPGVYGCGAGIIIWHMEAYLMMKYRNKIFPGKKGCKYVYS